MPGFLNSLGLTKSKEQQILDLKNTIIKNGNDHCKQCVNANRQYPAEVPIPVVSQVPASIGGKRSKKSKIVKKSKGSKKSKSSKKQMGGVRRSKASKGKVVKAKRSKGSKRSRGRK